MFGSLRFTENLDKCQSESPRFFKGMYSAVLVRLAWRGHAAGAPAALAWLSHVQAAGFAVSVEP